MFLYINIIVLALSCNRKEKYLYRLPIIILFLAFFVHVCTSHIYGQEENNQATSTAKTITLEEEIGLKRNELTKRIKETKEALTVSLENGDNQVKEELELELGFLQRIDLLYTQQLALIGHNEELQTTKEQVLKNLKSFQKDESAGGAVHSFQALDSLRDKLYAQVGMHKTIEDAMVAAQEALDEAKSVFEEKERIRRHEKEALNLVKKDDEISALTVKHKHAQLESTIAAEQVRQRQMELNNQKLEEKVYQLNLSLLKEKVELLNRVVRFQKEELDEIHSELDDQEFKINQKLERAKLDLSLLDIRWTDARKRLDVSMEKKQGLIEEVEARLLIRQARQREVSILGNQLQHISEARTIWNRRFETFNGIADTKKLQEWETETKLSFAQINRESRLQSARLAELRRDLVTLDTKIDKFTNEIPNVLYWMQEQKRNLLALIKIYETSIIHLNWASRLHEKFLTEISSHITSVTWGERVDAFRDAVKRVWQYEITTVEDRPITVKKIVIALIFLIMGYILSRFLSRLLGRQILTRLRVPLAATTALQTITFYMMIMFFTLFALRIVNLPLTVFTILGGAFAIGIGFGSQNIINNFISGLILLAERPIKVGDLVQIDNIFGTIEHIGARSTRVCSSTNSHIIVPNSSFLENNVLNWTLSDDLQRTCVKVGVVYGSPVREVERLIRKAVDDHGKILKRPDPIILFADFGDNSLNFEVHFWIRARKMMERSIIESDIRFHIESLFKEAGIVIAFPQRDVHLDSVNPIDVRVVTDVLSK